MAAKSAAAMDRAVSAPRPGQIEKAYALARAQYAALGIDTDLVISKALEVPISVQCWQADDVTGLEVPPDTAVDGGGIQATGNYPGKARSGEEIRQDFDFAARLIPGTLRFNLHAMYAETGGKAVDRRDIEPRHYSAWIDWAKDRGYGLDFNPTCFAHPMVKDGLTLSSPDRNVRQYWIDHTLACRKIAQTMARKLDGACVNNIWIPDGRKDSTVDRVGPRARLIESLDAILARRLPGVIDAVESKLFGIGCEDYTVGSSEFYLAYAVTRKVALCFDMGHFHPTESVADKLSAALLFLDRVLVHASRGVRWDSDHVVKLNDDLRALCDQWAQIGRQERVIWAMDFFDASINRVAAWTIGVRALRKGLLRALLVPWDALTEVEYSGNGAAKLALLERVDEMPLGAVWDYACLHSGAGIGSAWLTDVARYEADVLRKR